MPDRHALIVRLPSGTEYWYSNVPEVGAALTYLGTRYVVVSTEPGEDERIVVTLAVEEPSDTIAHRSLT
jgi:hypothetical protein